MMTYHEEATKLINKAITTALADYVDNRWLKEDYIRKVCMPKDAEEFGIAFDYDSIVGDAIDEGIFFKEALLREPVYYVPNENLESLIDGQRPEFRNCIFFDEDVMSYRLALPSDPIIIYTDVVVGDDRIPWMFHIYSNEGHYSITQMLFTNGRWTMLPTGYSFNGFLKENGHFYPDVTKGTLIQLVVSRAYNAKFLYFVNTGLTMCMAALDAINKAGNTFTFVEKRSDASFNMNKKRMTKGKKPVYETRTIVIEPRTFKYSQHSDGRGGYHMPEHEVMGHWHTFWIGSRKNNTREKIQKFVKPYTRGNIAYGRIDHNYAVSK